MGGKKRTCGCGTPVRRKASRDPLLVPKWRQFFRTANSGTPARRHRSGWSNVKTSITTITSLGGRSMVVSVRSDEAIFSSRPVVNTQNIPVSGEVLSETSFKVSAENHQESARQSYSQEWGGGGSTAYWERTWDRKVGWRKIFLVIGVGDASRMGSSTSRSHQLASSSSVKLLSPQEPELNAKRNA